MAEKKNNSIVLIGPGGELHRAIALAVSEKNIPVLLATIFKSQEFAVHSIANELWALRREHSVQVQDVSGVMEIEDLFSEALDRYGSCSLTVFISPDPELVFSKDMEFQQIDPRLDIVEAVSVVLERIRGT